MDTNKKETCCVYVYVCCMPVKKLYLLYFNETMIFNNLSIYFTKYSGPHKKTTLSCSRNRTTRHTNSSATFLEKNIRLFEHNGLNTSSTIHSIATTLSFRAHVYSFSFIFFFRVFFFVWFLDTSNNLFHARLTIIRNTVLDHSLNKIILV